MSAFDCGRLLGLSLLTMLTVLPGIAAATAGPALMPLPAQSAWTGGRLPVGPGLSVALGGADNARLRRGIGRFLLNVEERTGLTLAHRPNGEFAMDEAGGKATISIICDRPGGALPELGEDESYTLHLAADHLTLHAATVFGALHGLATLQQLLQAEGDGWFWPTGEIRDRPRFPWRGLMIDVARHWQPPEVIERNLDGMALVKLNVLHLHLTDDQGFRIESRKFPQLQALGSDGHYFTQEQMRSLIAYAADRGIRVVPEFDLPGHATSWVTAFPELASLPGPYAIERRWGVFDPVLDPTNPKVYDLLDGFFGEMAALFPDPYLHLGGDENNGVQWAANPRIQAFVREHGLNDRAGLHGYFNLRVNAILTRLGKRLMGWDEILHPGLPAGSVIQSWRGADGIVAAATAGYPTVLSHGYYIDLNHSAEEHYLNDPLPPGTTLTAAEQKLVLGGEATMWSEWVTPETIDSRIWPRTAAIAERLWSPAGIRDVSDMYRRLAIVSHRLEEAGLRHHSYIDPGLRRLARDRASVGELAALRALVDLIEPVQDYRRGRLQPESNQFTPLDGLVDLARPDSAPARDFSAAVESRIFAPALATADWADVLSQLDSWQRIVAALDPGLAAKSPAVLAAQPLLDALKEASLVGQQAVRMLAEHTSPEALWLARQLTRLDQAGQAHGAVILPVVAPLRLLVAAAACQSERKTLSPEAWRRRLTDLAKPPRADP